jgi:hypothetical protein
MHLASTPARRRLGIFLGLLTTVTAVVWPIAAAPAGAASTTVPASADARVAQSSANANFGTATTLGVDKSPVLESFVAFDVPDPGAAVSRAVLRLFVTNQSGNGPKVYRSDTGWSETAVTWNTRPARHDLLADLGAVTSGH